MTTFEEQIAISEARGEPFHIMTKRTDGSFQVSVRSSYDPSKAFACDVGKTPTEAMERLNAQRSLVNRKRAKSAMDLI